MIMFIENTYVYLYTYIFSFQNCRQGYESSESSKHSMKPKESLGQFLES